MAALRRSAAPNRDRTGTAITVAVTDEPGWRIARRPTTAVLLGRDSDKFRANAEEEGRSAGRSGRADVRQSSVRPPTCPREPPKLPQRSIRALLPSA